jgi:hypothetical protein
MLRYRIQQVLASAWSPRRALLVLWVAPILTILNFSLSPLPFVLFVFTKALVTNCLAAYVAVWLAPIWLFDALLKTPPPPSAVAPTPSAPKQA